MINGITINVTVSEFPDFTLNQRYLLFIDLDASRGVATVSVGPPGVYLVDANGLLVHVYDAEPDDTIGSGFAANYGSNINTFINAINPPPPSTCDNTFINAINPPPPSTCDPVQEQNCYDAGGDWNASTCRCSVPPDPCVRKPWLCQ